MQMGEAGHASTPFQESPPADVSTDWGLDRPPLSPLSGGRLVPVWRARPSFRPGEAAEEVTDPG